MYDVTGCRKIQASDCTSSSVSINHKHFYTPINIHVIEAYLDVSNRSHSFNVQFQVSPGSVDPSDVQIREARISKPSSSSLHETHRLYRYDKVT